MEEKMTPREALGLLMNLEDLIAQLSCKDSQTLRCDYDDAIEELKEADAHQFNVWREALGVLFELVPDSEEDEE